MPTTHNSLPIIYPKHINLFLQCPERYFHERVERQKIDQPFSPAMTKGIAVHQILNDAAVEYRRHGTVPANLVERAEALVPRSSYPSDLAWCADVESVVAQVKFGIAYLDGEACVLASEATYQYPYQRGRDCPPFALAAKVDLVLLRHDADGQPFLDVVDFKSGTSLRADTIQELAGRIVVEQNAERRFGLPYAYVQTSTVYVGVGAVRSEVLDAEECGRRWSQTKQVVAAIVNGNDWEPNPSPMCEWCPFFNNGCSLTVEDGDDDLGEWLDRVAD
ncbi:MAG: PD-(D/E)XK nuclease family protein [Chloroflexota bacterium]|nr:PD-(D/E)XK nuclease family protein [Chloroflexota bacterium]